MIQIVIIILICVAFIGMVQLDIVLRQGTYIPLEQNGSRKGLFTLAGLVEKGVPRLTKVIPLQVEMDERGDGKYTLLKGVQLDDRTLAQLFPAFQCLRSAVLDMLYDGYLLMLRSNNMHGYVHQTSEPLGQLKILTKYLKVDAMSRLVQAYMKTVGARRNNYPDAEYYCWTGDGFNDLHATQPLISSHQGNMLTIDAPIRLDEEATALRVAKAQWQTICRYYGYNNGMEIMKFIETGAILGLNNDIRDSTNGFQPNKDHLLTLFSKISNLPMLDTVPDAFVYFADRIILLNCYLFVRSKISLQNWLMELSYDSLFPMYDAQTLSTLIDTTREHFEIDQVGNRAMQGDITIKMIPVCGMSTSSQYNHSSPGGANRALGGVKLTRIDFFTNAPANSPPLHYFAPQEINWAQEESRHINLTYDRTEGKPTQDISEISLCRVTIQHILPAIMSLEIPNDVEISRPPEYWPVHWSYNNQFPLIPNGQMSIGLIDSLCLEHVTTGKQYALSETLILTFYSGIETIQSSWRSCDLICGNAENFNYYQLFLEVSKLTETDKVDRRLSMDKQVEQILTKLFEKVGSKAPNVGSVNRWISIRTNRQLLNQAIAAEVEKNDMVTDLDGILANLMKSETNVEPAKEEGTTQ